MKIYQKRPVTYEATQFRVADKATHARVSFGMPTVGAKVSSLNGQYWVNTTPHLGSTYLGGAGVFGGPRILVDGEWVVVGIDGSVQVYSPEAFVTAFEAVG